MGLLCTALSSLKTPEICPEGIRGLGTLEASGTTRGRNRFKGRLVGSGRGDATKLAEGKGTSLRVRQTCIMSPHPSPRAVTVPSYETLFTPKKILQMESESGWLHLGITGRTRQGVKKGCLSCCENHSCCC